MRLRWHGDPTEAQQPDVGDVLTVLTWVEGIGYAFAGRSTIYRVDHARRLTRGPHVDHPHELVLQVHEDSVAAWSDPTAARFNVIRDRGDRR